MGKFFPKTQICFLFRQESCLTLYMVTKIAVNFRREEQGNNELKQQKGSKRRQQTKYREEAPKEMALGNLKTL